MKKLFFVFLLLSQLFCVSAQGGGSKDIHLLGFASDLQFVGFAQPLDVSVLVGPHFYLGEYDWNAKFVDWWTFPAVDVAVTYWLTKTFAIGGSVGYRQYKGLGSLDDDKSTFGYDVSDSFYENTSFVQTRGAYLNLHFNGSMDLTRYFHMDVRNEYRMIAYVGLGMSIATQAVIHRGGWSFQAGLRNQWVLDSHWNLEATICGHLISDDFDGEFASIKTNNVPVDGALSILLGCTYKFHKRFGE